MDTPIFIRHTGKNMFHLKNPILHFPDLPHELPVVASIASLEDLWPQ